MKTEKKQKMDNRAKVQVCFRSHFSFSGPRPCFPNIQDYLILFSPSSVILLVHTTLAQYVDDECW